MAKTNQTECHNENFRKIRGLFCFPLVALIFVQFSCEYYYYWVCNLFINAVYAYVAWPVCGVIILLTKAMKVENVKVTKPVPLVYYFQKKKYSLRNELIKCFKRWEMSPKSVLSLKSGFNTTIVNEGSFA